ncbi:hypothetical protein HJG54_31790 [Leptolyngbya sp. NK1-12]|uniref:Uncharacterized protein n=1 Tax=Leptolyngbya sp. NK1-12 TaxID=2547451 RepID=A0AA96WL36_9CYAN|nr:hypothetical protein [Leptolyngbya sp. NK1-12]WNZ27463.1 hypothetical protein HJG54_31790 [Leptolyngbya sp. NK1-12]
MRQFTPNPLEPLAAQPPSGNSPASTLLPTKSTSPPALLFWLYRCCGQIRPAHQIK